MKLFVNWIANALVIVIAAYLLPGVHVANFWTALVLAVVLGILNLLIKPFVILLTLPLTILTLGLFTLIINACLILLAGMIVHGFSVDSFWWAFLFSILMSLINMVVRRFEK